MIKSELIEHLSAQNPDLRKKDVEKIVNAMLDAITAAMARSDRVELRAFGAFSSRCGTEPHAPAVIRAQRRFFRSSRPERKCASG
jgi:integration host factor subunit beta